MGEQGKEPLPQTVEALQECMARDAEIMLQMREEIGRLKHKLNQERQRREGAEARAYCRGYNDAVRDADHE